MNQPPRRRTDPRPAMQQKPQSAPPQRKRPNLRNWISVGCVVVGVFCVIRLCTLYSQKAAVSRQQEENLALVSQTEAPTPTPAGETAAAMAAAETPEKTVSAVPTATARPSVTRSPVRFRPEMQTKFRELYEKNNDLVGWLKVNCLYRINFAIVQGKNNFYMDHDFSKAENVNGAPFLDETCKIWPRDDNLILYAHNMKSGEMFGELNELQNRETLYADPFTVFDTLYEQGVYVPLAVFVCSVVQAEDSFQFYVRNFSSEEIFEEYIARAKELSLISLETDVRYGDELLTLVTCYDRENTQRFVVLLRKLREEETEASVKAAYFAPKTSE